MPLFANQCHLPGQLTQYGVSVPFRAITITNVARKEEQDRDLSYFDVPLFPASLSAAKGSSRDLRQVSNCDIRRGLRVNRGSISRSSEHFKCCWCTPA